MKKTIMQLKKSLTPIFSAQASSKIHKSVIIVLTSSLLVVSNANAAALSSQMTELSDQTLSQLRGKFIAPGEIMYFGVEMVTHWQASTGELVTASANLGVDFSNAEPQIGFVPTITVQQNGGSATAPSSTQNTAVASGGAGLDNVTGVVQNIQVAGVSNGINNTIGLTVEASSTPTTNNLPSVTGPQTASQITPNGSTASVDLSSNRIGVAVTVPDQGRAIQQIRNTTAGGQVQQSVQVGGNLNQIRNRINLNVQMNPLSSNLSSSASDLLSSVRLLAPSTAF
jgi:hypothetical protein